MPLQDEMPRVPVIDLSLFDVGGTWRDHTAAQVDEAASALGFFRVIGHGIEPAVVDSMLEASRAFFGQPGTTKVLYFREELADDDEHPHPGELQPRNVFPDLPGFREAVLDYMNALSGLGHRLMASIGRGLRLGDNYFVDRYTGRPTTLFRISRDVCHDVDGSPNVAQSAEGLLTLFHDENDGGLQVRRGSRWIDAPYVPGSFIVGIGDVLERLTSGHYVSAAHRMINESGHARIGLPFSFGPCIDAVLSPIASLARVSDRRTLIRLTSEPARRCDGAYS
jgi:isopenicillin N synthase-like dioxygenase